MMKLIKTVRAKKEFEVVICKMDVEFEFFEASYLYYDYGEMEFTRIIVQALWMKGDTGAEKIAQKAEKARQDGWTEVLNWRGDLGFLESAEKILSRK